MYSNMTECHPLGHFLTVLCEGHVVLDKGFKVLSMGHHILDSLLPQPQVTPGVTF